MTIQSIRLALKAALLGFVLASCSSPEDAKLKGFADIASTSFNPDGTVTVTCKDGRTERLPNSELARACDPLPAGNPALDLAGVDGEYCASFQDGSTRCFEFSREGVSTLRHLPPFFGQAKQLDLQLNQACAVDDEGAVQCWGNNSAGIMAVKPDVITRGSARKVAVGLDAACALRADGQVSCWGDGSFSQVPTTIPADLAPAKDIMSLGYAMCGIRADDTARCWGDSAVTENLPRDLGPVKKLYANSDAVCAIRRDETVGCWSTNPFSNPITNLPGAQLTQVTDLALGPSFACALRRNNPAVCWGDNSLNQAVFPPNLGLMKKLAIGDQEICAIAENGELRCWAFGGVELESSPTRRAKHIIAGETSACGIDDSGRTFCWGKNELNLRGAGGFPSSMFAIDEFVDTETMNEQTISLGRGHSCFLQQGFLQCNGQNFAGQGRRFDPIDDGENRRLVSGSHHNCALRTDGTVACWGDNARGQINVPRDLGPAKGLAAGFSHSCAVTRAGQIRCWGNNEKRQTTVPLGLGTANKVVAGEAHTCALLADGRVSCWGDSAEGQLNVPSFGQNVVDITAGAQHTCAVLQDRSVRCWGSNSTGESNVPKGLGAVKQLAAGAAFTCAIRAQDDSISCWGRNEFGQASAPALDDLIDPRFELQTTSRSAQANATDNIMFQTNPDIPNSYTPSSQAVFAYEGLERQGEQLAYDLEISYQADCLILQGFVSSQLLALAAINPRYAETGKAVPIAASGATNTIVSDKTSFRNLRGRTLIYGGIASFSSFGRSNDRLFQTPVNVGGNGRCTFSIVNVSIIPTAETQTIVREYARGLNRQLNDTFNLWLLARLDQDKKIDSVPARKAEFDRRQDLIAETALRFLVSAGISPLPYTGTSSWDLKTIKDGLFRAPVAELLLADNNGTRSSQQVRQPKLADEWPAWVYELTAYEVPVFEVSGTEFLAQELEENFTLLVSLRETVEAAPGLFPSVDASLKKLLSEARDFLASSREVSVSIEQGIRDLLTGFRGKAATVCQVDTSSPENYDQANCR